MCNLKILDKPKKLKTYSVLIAWDDNDDDAGDYGETVRAESPQEAERMVREYMRTSHQETYGLNGDEGLNEDDTFGGRLLELSEGAIWKAKELEAALREMVRTHDAPPSMRGVARDAAKALLAEIDSY
jgi:hypothetical protein